MEMLRTHPPQPDEEAIRATYLQALHPGRDREYALGQQRHFLNSVISRLVCSPDDNMENTSNDEQLWQNSSLLLQYIVAVLESDMANLCSSKAQSHPTLRDIKSSIVGSIFWPGPQQVSIHKHCKEILDFLTASLDLWKTDNNQMVVSKMLLNIVSLLGSCLRIADQTERLPTKILKGERVSYLVYELARILSDLPENVLQFVLTVLSPAWLGLGICHLLTDAMDDSLILGHLLTEHGEITLSNIVSRDLFLLPTLVGKDSPTKVVNCAMKEDHTLSVRRISGSVVKLPNISNNKSIPDSRTSSKMPGTMKRAVSKLNRRNAKGETPLHTACARNNVVRVRELLSASGIEVNARDNFGWAPLHEATCKGHVDCVLELLKYKPALTISSYFSKISGASGEKVDLLAANIEGVTALHEAVIYNRLDVAHTLMQYGGQRLLEAKTISGDTPLSLCQSEEMRAVLTVGRLEVFGSPWKLRRASQNLSQCFQDSQNSFIFSQECFSTPRSEVPTPEMYTAVLGEHPSRLHVSREDCLRYICIVQNKLRLYITCNRLTEAALHGSLSKENIRGDLKVFLGYDTPKKPLKPVSVSASSIEYSVKKSESFLAEKGLKEALSQLEEDVNVYMNLRLYLERFRLHIKHICAEKDYREMKPQLGAWICLCLF
ncbi:SMC5-SMC6 complex localization factor protein 1-like [Liolophura sinensis]|uniref:SMC5-SMC6 complex localization factor protein 1-like n=1 Tax=Liolophura sinensis TaxID=3198878 RepID=UPI003158B61B